MPDVLPDVQMTNRAERTRQAILKAAAQLFGKRDFEDVTMREIAKAAGCSHTTIYIYFRDKEELLNRLAATPLKAVKSCLEVALADGEKTPEERLFSLSRQFVRLALEHRTLYAVFFTAKASRVDEQDPALHVQRLRNDIFNLVARALWDVLRLDRPDKDVLGSDRVETSNNPEAANPDPSIAPARVYFFLLHGIIASYVTGEESVDDLFARLEPTFHFAFESLLAGLRASYRGAREGGSIG